MPASNPQPFEASAEERPWHLRVRAVIWRLIVSTVGSCMRYRDEYGDEYDYMFDDNGDGTVDRNERPS